MKSASSSQIRMCSRFVGKLLLGHGRCHGEGRETGSVQAGREKMQSGEREGETKLSGLYRKEPLEEGKFRAEGRICPVTGRDWGTLGEPGRQAQLDM